MTEHDKKIIGAVMWSSSYAFVMPKLRIHIEGLIVDQNYRSQEVGKKLMHQQEEVAQKYKPCIIDLTSGIRRSTSGTHDFYKSLGYQNEGYMAKLYLRKEL